MIQTVWKILPGVFFWEFPLSLHVEHEISTIHIFNNKEQSVKEANVTEFIIFHSLEIQTSKSDYFSKFLQSFHSLEEKPCDSNTREDLTCFLSENRSGVQLGRDD